MYLGEYVSSKEIKKQELDPNEFINVKEKTLHDFRQILKSGKMTDVEVGYLGLDHLKLL